MASPGIQLSFKKIFGVPGGYAERWEDRPRPGISGHRFYYQGKRGEPTTLSVVQYFTDAAEAQNALDNYRQAIGREVVIINELDNQQHQVFLHNLVPDVPRTILTNLPNVTVQITAKITFTQTA